MKLRLFPLFALLALASTLPTHADLVWDSSTGSWHAEGGVLTRFFGEEYDAQNAMELMNIAKQRQEKKDYFKALGIYQKVAKNYSGSIFAPEALYQSAIIHTDRHQYDKAFNKLNGIVTTYPDYSKFDEVISQQFEIASQLMQGKRPYFWGIFPSFKNKEAAINYFDDVVKNAPYSRQAPVALLNMAFVAQSRGETEQAIDALDRLITNYPRSVLAPDAYLTLAETFAGQVHGAWYDQGSTREAINYFQDYMILYPDDKYVARAEEGLTDMQNVRAKSRFLIGQFYYKYRNNPEAALVFLNDAITVAPNSEFAQKARLMIERINQGSTPPKTPMQWLLGKYDGPGSPSEDRQPSKIPNAAALSETAPQIQEGTSYESDKERKQREKEERKKLEYERKRLEREWKEKDKQQRAEQAQREAAEAADAAAASGVESKKDEPYVSPFGKTTTSKYKRR